MTTPFRSGTIPLPPLIWGRISVRLNYGGNVKDWGELLLGLLQTGVWAFALYMLGRFLISQLEGQLGKATERVRKIGPVEFSPPTVQQKGEPANPIAVEHETSSSRMLVAESSLSPAQKIQLESVKAWLQSLPASDREEQTAIALANWQLSWNFEVLNQQVFGSQLSVLGQANTSATPEASVRSAYDLAVSYYPQTYANYSFESWLGWMVNVGLLYKHCDGFITTAYGREFLRYIIGRGYSLSRFN